MDLSKILKITDNLFKEYKQENHPGSQLGIIHQGEIIYKSSHGLADMERSVSITESTLFDVASISKQFTAACILLLEQEGKISTEENIINYFPDAPDYYEGIRIKELLSHTSGIKDYMDLFEESGLSESNAYWKEELLKLILACPLEKDPGTEFSYSNSNYFLLMSLIEGIEKISLSEFAHKKIFRPLGMNNTCFYDDHKKILKNRALSYKKMEDGSFQNFPYIFDIVGDTGLLTNIHDLQKWDECFYMKHPEIISKQTIEKLNTKQTLKDGKEINYSFGLFIEEIASCKAVCHWGEAAGYISGMVRIPEKELTVICLSNFLGMNDPAWEIAEAIIKNII